MTGTLDLSTLPPSVVIIILILWVIGRVLPDQVGSHEADRPASAIARVSPPAGTSADVR